MILGFAGKAASGKTTAALHLVPLLGRETHVVPMARVLRDEVEQFLRQAGAAEQVPLLYGDQDDKLKTIYVDSRAAGNACGDWERYLSAHQEIQDRPGESAITVRRILQWWGTEYRRAEDPDYWTKAWAKKIRDYDLEQCHILVDDVRFFNELRIIRSLGGRFVKIDRPGFAAGGNHASETSLDGFDDWDAVVLNDGSLDQFRQKVNDLVDLAD